MSSYHQWLHHVINNPILSILLHAVGSKSLSPPLSLTILTYHIQTQLSLTKTSTNEEYFYNILSFVIWPVSLLSKVSWYV